MVNTKLLIAALAAQKQATPLASKHFTETAETDFYGPGILDWADVDLDAFGNESNWRTEPNEEVIIEDTFTHPTCKQDGCPDYHPPFDLMYTLDGEFKERYLGHSRRFDKNAFASNSAIRVCDYDRCILKQIGTGIFGEVPGRCWEFNLCDRPQTICINPGNSRAHRVWGDTSDKKCYDMRTKHLG
ncbi:hypothetical protein ACHAPU_002278 [Fusarium lateritium]